MLYTFVVIAAEVALKRVSGVMALKTGVMRKRYDVPAVRPVTVADATVLLARANSFQMVPSVETSTLYVVSPVVMAGAVHVRLTDVLLPATLEARTFVTLGLPVVITEVVAWPLVSSAALKLGVMRKRYEVAKVRPVTVALVAIDAVRSKTVQVTPSVDTSI